MSLGNKFLRFAMIYALIGLAIGVWMGASGDFRIRSAHAHLNLLGYVSMFLAGLFYRSLPKAAEDALAGPHFLLANATLIALIPLVALINLQVAPAVVGPILGVTTFVTWATMALFAIIVWRNARD